jgi:hypothetical protein
MQPLESIVYVELNQYGDPQLLLQHRMDPEHEGIYYRLYDVFGESGTEPAEKATRPQQHFFLRTIEDLSPFDVRTVDAEGAAMWADPSRFPVVWTGGWGGVRLTEPPDLSGFWLRATLEEGDISAS